MKYEWDEKKNTENIHKHGLDFAEAFNIFQNPLLIKMALLGLLYINQVTFCS